LDQLLPEVAQELFDKLNGRRMLIPRMEVRFTKWRPGINK